jgi:hypothetical protein
VLTHVNGAGKRVGTASLQSPTIAAFDANAGLATAMGGTAVRETYYAHLKCHDPSGDDYYVTFTRKTVRISSYQDDAIQSKIERLRQTWSPCWSEPGAFTPSSPLQTLCDRNGAGRSLFSR